MEIANLKTYKEAHKFYLGQTKKFGIMKYRSTPEYKILYAKMQELIKAEGIKPQRRKRVKISISLFIGQ